MSIWPRERRRLDKYKAKIKLKLTECNKQTTQQARPSQALKGDIAWILVYKYYHLFYVTTKRQDKGKMAFEAMCYYTESTLLIIWINWVFFLERWSVAQKPRKIRPCFSVEQKKNLMKEADKKRKTKQNKRKIFPKKKHVTRLKPSSYQWHTRSCGQDSPSAIWSWMTVVSCYFIDVKLIVMSDKWSLVQVKPLEGGWATSTLKHWKFHHAFRLPPVAV